MTTSSSKPLRPLKGVRILSLCLNLPGPAALMRCRQMGATCVKLEPPAPAGAAPGTAYTLPDVELASRLSFFLWSSIPDDELLDAAVSAYRVRPALARALVEWTWR